MSASAASSSSEGEARRRGKVCVRCSTARAQLRRPKNRQPYCKECFFQAFEEEVHDTIIGNHLFTRGDRVAVGASGGKDSTVLAYVLNKLNKEHEYGVELLLLSVDEGITGYRDDSLETVEHNRDAYGLPLTIVSYKDLYGWTMDEIVAEIGRKNNCTFCGVFRRQALDRGAHHLSATKIATGHNADDIAETVIMNGSDGELPRCKPFKYAYEKEIVLYAHFRQLEYFSTECVYSPYAYRGFAREFIKDLEAADPHSILDIIHAGETMTYARMPADRVQVKQSCTQCGFISSNALCQACQLLQSLNAGLKGQRAKRPDRVQVGYTEG